MTNAIDRRQFLKLAGLGGVVFASGLPGVTLAAGQDDFYFVQLSDTHWGFRRAAQSGRKGNAQESGGSG
jgi:hypothetical protein